MQTRNPETKLSNILGITSFANGSTGISKAPEGGLLIQTQLPNQLAKTG